MHVRFVRVGERCASGLYGWGRDARPVRTAGGRGAQPPSELQIKPLRLGSHRLRTPPARGVSARGAGDAGADWPGSRQYRGLEGTKGLKGYLERLVEVVADAAVACLLAVP
jgi:hypothetical protein